MASPEQFTGSGERGIENVGDAAAERQAELLTSPEKTAEKSPEQTREAIENAKNDIEKAISKERPSHELGTAAPTAHHVKPATTKAARAKAYDDILRHTRSEMSAPARAFSKIIHNPAVEKTSQAVGSTVARPNSILFGALFAIILSGGVYLIARYYGYALSGFEAIGAFIIGWVFGLVVDFVRLALRTR